MKRRYLVVCTALTVMLTVMFAATQSTAYVVSAEESTSSSNSSSTEEGSGSSESSSTGESSGSSESSSTEGSSGSSESSSLESSDEGTGSAEPESAPSSAPSDDTPAPSRSHSKEESAPAQVSVSADAAFVMASDAPVLVAGGSVKTQMAGAYVAEKVRGVAVIDSKESIKASLGLKEGQTPYIMVYDTDVKKSNKAMDSINAAVEALGGGKIAATLNIDLGAREKGGRFVRLADGTTNIVVGLPKEVPASGTFKVVCVQPGGQITVMDDITVDSARGTVTFEVKAGLGTYSIVSK